MLLWVLLAVSCACRHDPVWEDVADDVDVFAKDGWTGNAAAATAPLITYEGIAGDVDVFSFSIDR